jgi:hypothetical protein
MREYSANDLDHLVIQKPSDLHELEVALTTPDPAEPPQPALPTSATPIRRQLDELIMWGKVRPDNLSRGRKILTWIRSLLQEPFPGPYYPRFLRRRDIQSFHDYVGSVASFSVTATPVTEAKPGARNYQSRTSNGQSGDDQPKSSSPTFLSLSQKIYDAEVSRRDSINTRCSAVLSTAAILGTLVVAASQLGLTLRSTPITKVTLTVLAFFLVSLVYLGYSITIALRVHGDIQGVGIDFDDLKACNPDHVLDLYNFDTSEALLIYGKLNWCLNNNFKYRLHSAGRALRNGVIAVIVAGALSPWALMPSTSTNSTLPTTHLSSSQAVASTRPFKGSPNENASVALR